MEVVPRGKERGKGKGANNTSRGKKKNGKERKSGQRLIKGRTGV